MIPKNTAKFIKSLQIKKYRQKENAFLVEGAKNVLELMKSDFNIIEMFLTNEFIARLDNEAMISHFSHTIVKESELTRISALKTNNAALAVVEMEPNEVFAFTPGEYGIVLDDIRDPGNLGTIIRIADWYGINKIICSETSADQYNPKVVAASMGSFTRVSISYQNLASYLPALGLPVLGAFLNGENVHHFEFPGTGLILVGNESSGINPSLEKLVRHKLSIPRFGGAESLNAGIATAVICDNLRRK